MEKMRFEGKVVIVTGASSGIGRSTARLFAMEGAKVVAAARRLKRLEDLRDKVAAENAPGVILPVKTDVRDPAQIDAMFDTCLKEFGHLDILVNNAGMLDGQLPIHETPQEVYDMIYETNQRAVYLCCQRAIKIFLEQVVNGADWIACEDPSYLADYDIDFEALIGPMMYNSIDEYSYVCQSDLVKGMCQKLEDNYGIHVLALDFNVGMRCMQTNKVIKTPADLKGMKIRVPNSSMYINCLTAMGATPTGMPFSETISAVQQGVIDGLEGNMNAYSTNGSAEVCKNMSLTNHLVGTCGAYISTKVWNSIPEEYRTIIQEEFTKGAKELTDFTNASFAETKAKLEKEQGCSFNEVDVDAFRAAVQPEFDRMVKEDGVTPTFYEQAQAILAEYRQANK